jgi:hypothetical protein
VEYSIRSSYFLSPPTDEEVRQRQRQGKARQGKARQGKARQGKVTWVAGGSCTGLVGY